MLQPLVVLEDLFNLQDPIRKESRESTKIVSQRFSFTSVYVKEIPWPNLLANPISRLRFSNAGKMQHVAWLLGL